MRFLTCLFLSGSMLLAQTSNPAAAAGPSTGDPAHTKNGPSGKSSEGTTPSSCGTRCGVERWPLKTLTDADAGVFQNATATDTTVPKLVSEQAPPKLTDARAPLEKQLFRLKALVIGWKEELGSTAGAGASAASSGSTSVPDHDFHIVIADPANLKTQMIIEVPDPACQAVCSSAYLDKIKAARSAVSGKLGQPTATVVELPKPWLVEVTGPALFDFAHGQDGLAKNCIEIHPVLDIKFLQEQSSGPMHVNTKQDKLPHTCGQK
jgi:hypothetical protein